MTYVELVFSGKLSVPKDVTDKFLQDFEIFLQEHDVEFDGKIRSYEFEQCEVLE